MQIFSLLWFRFSWRDVIKFESVMHAMLVFVTRRVQVNPLTLNAPLGGTLQSFIGGGSTPKSNPQISFWKQFVSSVLLKQAW